MKVKLTKKKLINLAFGDVSKIAVQDKIKSEALNKLKDQYNLAKEDILKDLRIKY